MSFERVSDEKILKKVSLENVEKDQMIKKTADFIETVEKHGIDRSEQVVPDHLKSEYEVKEYNGGVYVLWHCEINKRPALGFYEIHDLKDIEFNEKSFRILNSGKTEAVICAFRYIDDGSFDFIRVSKGRSYHRQDGPARVEFDYSRGLYLSAYYLNGYQFENREQWIDAKNHIKMAMDLYNE